jgi:hypothetical protein
MKKRKKAEGEQASPVPRDGIRFTCFLDVRQESIEASVAQLALN